MGLIEGDNVSVLIKNQTKPKGCGICNFWSICDRWRNRNWGMPPPEDCPIEDVPPHGRLIDADALRQSMYHEAFETDSPMQKWDSGCWIRYKMFERMEEAAPTIIPAEDAKDTNVPIKEDGEPPEEEE